MTDLGLLAWIREFAADSIGFDSKKLFEISCHPEKAGFSGSGFRILFARRGLFRVLVERSSTIAWLSSFGKRRAIPPNPLPMA